MSVLLDVSALLNIIRSLEEDAHAEYRRGLNTYIRLIPINPEIH